MSSTMFSGNFIENLDFRGRMDGMLNGADPSFGATRVRAALDAVDMGDLSTSEKNVLLAATGALAADGQISAADADILVGLTENYAQTGRFVDTLTGGNSGKLTDVFARSNSFLPFQPSDLSRYPGNPLFAGLLGAFVNIVVQKFQDMAFLGSAHAMLGSAGGGLFGIGTLNKMQVANALNGADLSRLNPQERASVLGMIGFAAADGYVSSAEARAICDCLRRCQRPDATIGLPSVPGQSSWSVDRQDGGRAVIDLGRYTLHLNENNSEMVLENKATGERTRIWGDPHFEVDGQRVGDFYDTLTLSLEDGTKITIDTVPWAQGNDGQTLSSRLTITRGDDAIVVEGLDQNTHGDLKITEMPAGSGQLVDVARPDGTIIYENPEGSSWLRLDSGGWLTIDREFLRQV